MNAISRMSVSLLICVSAYAGAGPCKNAGEAHVARLAAAAWKEYPVDIDVTLYMQQKEAPKSLEEIRQIWEGVFSGREESERELSAYELERRKKNIEINVERMIKEQQVGRWFKKRVRMSGDRRRIDQTYIRPEVIFAQGGDPSEFEPQGAVALNDPCDLTGVSVPDNQRGGYTYFAYSHTTATKSVQISNKRGPGGVNIDSIRLAGLPRGVRVLLQSLLGVKENTSNGVFYVPDSEKLDKLENTELEEMSVSVCPDSKAPEKRDRVEIKIPADAGQAGIILICEREDYSRVYHFEARNATNGQTLIVRKSSEFDSQGFPRKVVTTEYNIDGSLKKEQTYIITKVKLTPSIPDHVFEFNPPEDYVVTDHRTTPREMDLAEVARLKKWLGHEKWSDRLKALAALGQHLKDKPAELRKIAIPLLDDEHPAVRERALRIIRQIGSRE